MAPTKNTRALGKQTAIENQPPVNSHVNLMPLARKALQRKAANMLGAIDNVQDQNMDAIQTRGKRKAEHSPAKNEKVKRSALGNLTNNVKGGDDDDKQHHKKKEPTKVHVLRDSQNTKAAASLQPPPPQQQQQVHKITTRASSRQATKQPLDAVDKVAVELSHVVVNSVAKATAKAGAQAPIPPAAPHVAAHAHHVVAKSQQTKPVRRISNEFNKTEESLYMSALEDISASDSLRLSGNFEAARRRSALAAPPQPPTTDEKAAAADKTEQDACKPAAATLADELGVVHVVPEGVADFDKENWNDPFQVSEYAMDIFNYLKEREAQFPVADYMEMQVHLSKWMRSLLVDWMVEVQETFELNHETLYLAVKIVDLYLSRVVIQKDKLQLLGAAALFIACKFDERTPPLIEDFLYICDGAYKQKELIHMEMQTLRTIDYDLGIPLSYRFLRRYARCAKVPMPTLTLARYILELSLMDYATVSLSDSQLAAAALFIALRMHGADKPWSLTLEYYTGYRLEEFAHIVEVLNVSLGRKPKGTIKTIRSKYSHKIFHEVAKVPVMSSEKLFENNIDYMSLALSILNKDCSKA